MKEENSLYPLVQIAKLYCDRNLNGKDNIIGSAFCECKKGMAIIPNIDTFQKKSFHRTMVGMLKDMEAVRVVIVLEAWMLTTPPEGSEDSRAILRGEKKVEDCVGHKEGIIIQAIEKDTDNKFLITSTIDGVSGKRTRTEWEEHNIDKASETGGRMLIENW